MFKYFKLQSWFVVLFAGLCFGPQNADASSGLRSAYLGASVWNEGLSSREINDQLKDHFAEVLVQLEAKSASSLLTALTRAETSSVKPWSEDERRAALIHLAHNRQLQIKRLRDYMDRGRFPLNEGQSPEAVPIFVDRQGTHCAVGHLMHSDGKDAEVAQIVSANNLVRILSVQGGGLVRWIRTSGLTQEEAAMIQPGYFPIPGITTFESFLDPSAELQSNGLTLSDVSIRARNFAATLPPSFATDPSAIDAIFAQGLVELETNNVVGRGFPSGVVLGTAGTGLLDFDISFAAAPPPENLDTWLYFGSDDAVFGGLVQDTTFVPGNVGIVEIDYKIRAEEGQNFSMVGLNSTGGPPNEVFNEEQNAVLLLSKIYRGDSNDLLAEQQVFIAGDPLAPSYSTDIVGSDATSLSEDFLRIKTYGLLVGSGTIHSFYNQFETTASPALLGDVDLDGSVTFADIPSFIAVLQSGVSQPEADCNLDGDVDFGDIPFFVGILQTQ